MVATPYMDGVTVQPNGMPVMPDLDTEALSNAQFTQLLEEYLPHVWHTVGNKTIWMFGSFGLCIEYIFGLNG